MHLRRKRKLDQFVTQDEREKRIEEEKRTNEVRKTSCRNRVRTFNDASPWLDSLNTRSTESSEVNLRSVLVPGTVVGRIALSSGWKEANGNNWFPSSVFNCLINKLTSRPISFSIQLPLASLPAPEAPSNTSVPFFLARSANPATVYPSRGPTEKIFCFGPLTSKILPP